MFLDNLLKIKATLKDVSPNEVMYKCVKTKLERSYRHYERDIEDIKKYLLFRKTKSVLKKINEEKE